MPFFTLENGEEILLDVSDIPEPPASVFTDNPYEADSTRFKRWRSMAKARYAKAVYRSVRQAKDRENFIELVGSAKDVLSDPSCWEDYKSCRGVEDFKRPVGRPKLPPSVRKSPKGRLKRSDQMSQFLKDHGITVNADNGLEPTKLYEGWIFLPNGRVKFENEQSISVHAFLRDFT